MTERDFNKIGDAELEKMLRASVPDVPPDDVSRSVTPWKHAMNRCLVGIAITSILLSFNDTRSVLPVLGFISMILGFRSLRKTNKYFGACLYLTLVQSMIFFISLITGATVWNTHLCSMGVSTALSAARAIVGLFVLIFLWLGIRTVKKKAGIEPSSKSTASMIVWYVPLSLISFIPKFDLVSALTIVLSFAFMLAGFHRASKEIESAGYMMRTAPVRMHDSMIILIIALTLAAGIACAYIFANSYPMSWSEVPADEHAEIEDVKSELITLGFPEEVLSDLAPEDVLSCEGAYLVIFETEDHPVNEGREAIFYDEKELRITNVAVRLSEDDNEWKLFHHFKWTIAPDFYGTEAVCITEDRGGWERSSLYSGRLLYDKDGKTMTADFYSFDQGRHGSTLDGEFVLSYTESPNVYASFSLPNDGKAHRGYISYSVERMNYSFINVISTFSYVHQNTPKQYPVITAEERLKRISPSKDTAFAVVEDRLRFDPEKLPH